ncbi:MAG: hypothetical protein ACRDVE_07175 [Actinocrinis sp.]
MRPVVIADFNSPLCYLAGLWVDQRLAGGAEVDWRAVEHAPGLSALGVPAAGAPAFARELAEAARLPTPPGTDELPAALPQIITNTRAAVSAYAEAITDGVEDEIRRRLLHAIWIERRHLSSAYEVRRILADVMWPRVPLGPYLSTTLPRPMSGDPDPWKATRRQGGTIAPDGGPLTTIAYRRIRTWREQWRELGRPRLPILIDAHGTLHEAADAVLALAGRPPRQAPAPELSTERPDAAAADLTRTPSFH